MKIVHQAGCERGACGGVFKCNGCERWMGWCFGHSGEMEELCDDCWLDVTKAREAAAAELEAAV